MRPFPAWSGIDSKLLSAEDGNRIDSQLEIAREAREFAKRIAAAAQAWIEGLDEALRVWKTTLRLPRTRLLQVMPEARKSAEHLLSQSDPWGEEFDATCSCSA